MVLQGYEINITVSSVDVKQDDSDRPIKVRVYVSLALFAFAAILFYSVVFTSRNGYTTWWDLTNMPRGSADFSSAVLAATIAALLSGSLILVGVANYFPSGETLHCDHSTFIASNSVVQLSWSVDYSDVSHFRGVAATFRRLLVRQRQHHILPSLLCPWQEAKTLFWYRSPRSQPHHQRPKERWCRRR